MSQDDLDHHTPWQTRPLSSAFPTRWHQQNPHDTFETGPQDWEMLIQDDQLNQVDTSHVGLVDGAHSLPIRPYAPCPSASAQNLSQWPVQHSHDSSVPSTHTSWNRPMRAINQDPFTDVDRDMAPDASLEWHASTYAVIADRSSHSAAASSTAHVSHQEEHHNRSASKSVHSKAEWDAIRPWFKDIHIDRGATLETTMMVLELVLRFRAKEDDYNNRKRVWDECRKYKTDSSSKGTRPSGRAPLFPVYPTYFILRALRGVIPPSLSDPLYVEQTRLLLAIDKYVKGFFDSEKKKHAGEWSDRVDTARHIPAEWAWQKLSSGCQAVLIMSRKTNIMQQLHGLHEGQSHRRYEKREWLTDITKGVLRSNVFNGIAEVANSSNPYILSSFWAVCRILRALAPQIGYTEGAELMHLNIFIRALQDPLKESAPGHKTGLSHILANLHGVPAIELRETMRIGCLCTARTFTSRLGDDDPIVLDMWANYHRWFDPHGLDHGKFLESYRKAFQKTQLKYSPTHAATIMTLRGYADAAYFMCHENKLARQLADELWKRTWVWNGSSSSDALAWDANTQGMTEAAHMIGLLVCINHENKYKGRKEMNKIRRQENLFRKRKRKAWRAAFQLPPTEQANHAIDCLAKAAEKLESGDWDCRMAAASLFDTLAIFGGQYAQGDKRKRADLAREYRRRSEQIRFDVAMFQQFVQDPDVDMNS